MDLQRRTLPDGRGSNWAKHLPETLASDPLVYLRSMLDPAIALGIVMLIMALLVRLALLSVADLSFVLPMTAVGYVLAALTSAARGAASPYGLSQEGNRLKADPHGAAGIAQHRITAAIAWVGDAGPAGPAHGADAPAVDIPERWPPAAPKSPKSGYPTPRIRPSRDR